VTQEEADKLAAIFAMVDNGCSVCVRNVCQRASDAGFGFVWEHGEDWIIVPCSVFPDDVELASRYRAVTARPVS
jgi:hypothetical protein